MTLWKGADADWVKVKGKVESYDYDGHSQHKRDERPKPPSLLFKGPLGTIIFYFLISNNFNTSHAG